MAELNSLPSRENDASGRLVVSLVRIKVQFKLAFGHVLLQAGACAIRRNDLLNFSGGVLRENASE